VSDLKDRIVFLIAAAVTAILFIGGALLVLLVCFRVLGGL
jgi:hypothetical protein